jgi:hypothetical protein
VGTADTTAYYCVPAALDFRSPRGEKNIFQYLHWIAQQGAEVLARRLGTNVMDVAASSNGELGQIRQCAMANVRLPFEILPDSHTTSQLSQDFDRQEDQSTKSAKSRNEPPAPIRVRESMSLILARHMIEQLLFEHKTAAQIFPYKSSIWVRVSGQIYLELTDFEKYADFLIRVMDEVRHDPKFSVL